MQIITLTLSPAFDVHCTCEDFAPFRENLATITSREAGGKGVNISRALTQNNVNNLAIVALGEENALDFTNLLSGTGIDWIPLYRSGRIRENITLHGTNNKETRISFSGFSADDSLLSEAEAIVLSHLSDSKDIILTFTGRVPSGLSLESVKAFLIRLQTRGIKLVIDSKSFSKADILEIKPWLIKPNEEELSLYASREIQTESDIIETAWELSRLGIANAMISLGEKGAVLASQAGVFRAYAPKIDAISTIGAGDSSIAGFLAAYSKGKSTQDCLRLAVAFGSAACLTDGTQPPNPHDIDSITPQIKIERIST